MLTKDQVVKLEILVSNLRAADVVMQQEYEKDWREADTEMVSKKQIKAYNEYKNYLYSLVESESDAYERGRASGLDYCLKTLIASRD